MAYKLIPKKTLMCRECGDPVENVGSEAIGVTCSKCVIKNHFGGILQTEAEFFQEQRDKLEDKPEDENIV